LERYLNRQGKTNIVKGKILLLDDNKDLIQILQIILKGQGYDTVVATSVEEAKMKIKIHNPVLILMDVFICDDDGREFCKMLKFQEDTSNIRVILMSGCDESLNIMNQTVADDFMYKPFDYNDLLSRVERQMDPIAA
jgi:DNA-binding response OmpR family regulator